MRDGAVTANEVKGDMQSKMTALKLDAEALNLPRGLSEADLRAELLRGAQEAVSLAATIAVFPLPVTRKQAVVALAKAMPKERTERLLDLLIKAEVIQEKPDGTLATVQTLAGVVAGGIQMERVD